jgi:hypothetical protein
MDVAPGYGADAGDGEDPPVVRLVGAAAVPAGVAVVLDLNDGESNDTSPTTWEVAPESKMK